MLRVTNEISQKLHAYLASKGVEPWIARYISCRLAKVFSERAYKIIGAFEQAGWTYGEIHWLDSKSHAWRKQPEHVFMLQLALQGAGCPSGLARRLVMEPHVFEIQDLECMAACMRVMQEYRWREPQIRFAALRKPRILAMHPDDLRLWCDRFRTEGKDPILYLHTLNLLIQKAAAEPNESRPASQPAEHLPAMEDVWQAEAIRVKNEAECVSVVAIKKPKKTPHQPMPKLQLEKKPEQKPEPVPEPIKKPPSPAPPVPRTEVTADPKPAPRPLKPIPSTLLPTREPEIQREYVQDKRNDVNWRKLAEQILMAVELRWDDRKWQKWLKANLWIDEFCQKTKNLDQILHWVQFTGSSVPRDCRSKLFARVLLNRDNLGSILEIPVMALYLRFYAIRRALGREPMRKQHLLCLPFEQVQAKTEGPTRNLSIPPPAMADEDEMEAERKIMQAKFEEIRFRANSIRDKGKNPLDKPYINMILEPTQERFLARLTRYLEKPVSEKDLNASFRRPREFATPRSRLV